jgi:hypothetical protein
MITVPVPSSKHRSLWIRAVARGVVVTVAGVTTACGNAPEASRTDSAGVEVVESRGSGAWSDAERPTLAEVLRIGGSADDTLYQFGTIGGVDISSNGTIVVLDGQAAAVRLYDSAGRYVQSIGRSGRGPGELNESVNDMVVSTGDTVFVAGFAKSKVMRLLLSGGDRLLGIAYDENRVQHVSVLGAQSDRALRSLSRFR